MITSNGLKRIRLLLGLTQQQASEHIGVGPRQWGQYEKDDGAKSKIPERQLELFCRKNKIRYPLNEVNGVLQRAVVCSFSNIKGGVYKTFLTIAFAEYLERIGRKVLILDADQISVGAEGAELFGHRFPKYKTIDRECSREELEESLDQARETYDIILIDKNWISKDFPDLIEIAFLSTSGSWPELRTTIQTSHNLLQANPLSKQFIILFNFEMNSLSSLYEDMEAHDFGEKYAEYERYLDQELLQQDEDIRSLSFEHTKIIPSFLSRAAIEKLTGKDKTSKYFRENEENLTGNDFKLLRASSVLPFSNRTSYLAAMELESLCLNILIAVDSFKYGDEFQCGIFKR